MQELQKELSNQFDVEIASLTPFRDGYILVNGENKRRLIKKVPFSTNRVEFIHNVKEHLYSRGFDAIDRFRCTVDGTPYAEIEGDIYTLNDIFNGKECDFDNRGDLISAVRALSKMHLASKGFVASEDKFVKNNLGKVPGTLFKRLSDIKKMKKNAKKGRSKFDYLFLDHVDNFIRIAEDAIRQLEDSNYSKLVEEGRKEGSICHHDFTHNNVILGKDHAHIINFDSCCLELKIYDLANLIRRKMRKCGWNYTEAQLLIREYEINEKLSNDEIEVLLVMLKFPQKFWRVTNRFYNSRQSWSEKVYVGKLYEVINEIEPNKKMLQNLLAHGIR